MTRIPLIAVVLALGACSTMEESQVAQADCKVAPVTTASATGVRPRKADPLDQRYAEMQLATSEYRRDRLSQPLGTFNNVEDALRDCNK